MRFLSARARQQFSDPTQLQQHILKLIFFLAGILFGHIAMAQPLFGLCPSPLAIPAAPFVDEGVQAGDIYLSGDEADLAETGISTLRGDAEISRDGRQVRADKIEYDRERNSARIYGDIRYWEKYLFVQGDEGYIEFDNDSGMFNNTEYVFKQSRFRGDAEVLTVVEFGSETELEKVRNYTNCEPDNVFWRLSASTVSLDHTEDWGKARNVLLRVKNVPILYTPYLSFPLTDKRKTGLLTPTYGSSQRNGYEFSLPFYWNIGPAMDATITPRFFADAGVMIAGEYRHLLRRGKSSVNFEYLPDDRQFFDQDRGLLRVEHEQSFLDRGRFSINYPVISDRHYFEDFGDQLSLTSTRFLHRRAQISYQNTLSNNDAWDLEVRLHDYQNADPSNNSRPYKRLPQILFTLQSPPNNRGLEYGMSSELVHFDGEANQVDGLRLDLEPYIDYPINAIAGYINPRLALNITHYSLNNPENNPDAFAGSTNRVLPIFSFDSGIFLEREFKLFNKQYFQTLEPRLFYVYIPEEDQSDLPVFDTGRYDFSFDSLFRDRRFNGPDRLGDANQLAFAVTSYLNEADTGQYLGHLSLGQIYYFRDREISLPNQPVDSQSSSPIVAEIGANIIRDWAARSSVQWDPHGNGTEKLAAQLRYNSDRGRIVNLGYRRNMNDTNTDIEQSDISFRWPFNRRWSMLGRWNRSITTGQSLELFGGMEYQSCCWEVRTVIRRFLANTAGEFETEVLLQIELKGLTGIGTETVEFLQKQIPGYKSDF